MSLRHPEQNVLCDVTVERTFEEGGKLQVFFRKRANNYRALCEKIPATEVTVELTFEGGGYLQWICRLRLALPALFAQWQLVDNRRSQLSCYFAFVCCNTLQHTTTHCNTMQHTATRYAMAAGGHSQKSAL